MFQVVEYLTLKPSHMSQMKAVSLFQGQILPTSLSGFPCLGDIKHACWELSPIRESMAGMGPAGNILEVYVLELWRILFKSSLGTVDSRVIKTSKDTLSGRGQSPRSSLHLNDFVRVLLDLVCEFSFLFCNYNFPFLSAIDHIF